MIVEAFDDTSTMMSFLKLFKQCSIIISALSHSGHGMNINNNMFSQSQSPMDTAKLAVLKRLKRCKFW